MLATQPPAKPVRKVTIYRTVGLMHRPQAEVVGPTPQAAVESCHKCPGTLDSLRLVARAGDAAPGTSDGVVLSGFLRHSTSPSVCAINGEGQVAFKALIAGPGVDSTNNQGIFATDLEGNLHLIARTGDTFDIGGDEYRTISFLGFVSGSGIEDGRRSAFNDAGELAFVAMFSDHSSGVFVARTGPLTRTWGGSGGNDWSNTANWNTAVAFAQTDILAFTGNTGLNSNNDQVDRQIGGVKFAAGSGTFQLGGNALKLAGKINDQATARQEMNLPVEFVAGLNSGTINVISAGELQISQPVSGDQGLRKTGLGLLKLTQDAAYTGDTIVEAGVLEMAGLSNSDSTTVGTATTTATLITEHIRQDVLTINAGSKVTISATGGVSGTSVLNVLNLANTSGSFSWGAAGSGGTMQTLGEQNAMNSVPEPTSWGLLAMAFIAGLAAWRRNR